MKLSDFLAQLGLAGYHAAHQARQAAARTLEANIEDHPENEGEKRLKRIRLRLPGPTLSEDKGPLIEVPRWAIQTGGNLDLGKMIAKVEADINLAEADGELDGRTPRFPAARLSHWNSSAGCSSDRQGSKSRCTSRWASRPRFWRFCGTSWYANSMSSPTNRKDSHVTG